MLRGISVTVFEAFLFFLFMITDHPLFLIFMILLGIGYYKSKGVHNNRRKVIEKKKKDNEVQEIIKGTIENGADENLINQLPIKRISLPEKNIDNTPKMANINGDKMEYFKGRYPILTDNRILSNLKMDLTKGRIFDYTDDAHFLFTDLNRLSDDLNNFKIKKPEAKDEIGFGG